METIDEKIVLNGLIDCWNKTLLQLNLNPYNYKINFLLCKWKNQDTPKIYCYSSESKSIEEGSQVSGDNEAMPIISPYLKTNIEDMSFEQVICHFKDGYSAVTRKLNTVGGEIHIYELNQDYRSSKWIDRPSHIN
ncbi:hypothetical protein [Priestia megaterium]|uniref:hypothetical protein n=1 Tax=Priestia megaterium TaxID=1404 RepID=UPI003D065050